VSPPSPPSCTATPNHLPLVDRTHGFGKEHTGFKSVHQLWSNRGFTSSVGSLLTGGNYYYEKVAGGPRWQDQHPIYNDSQFVNKPGNCKEQLGKPTAMCTQEYSTALWGQLAVQAVEEHQLPAPIYVHLCFQAVRSTIGNSCPDYPDSCSGTRCLTCALTDRTRMESCPRWVPSHVMMTHGWPCACVGARAVCTSHSSCSLGPPPLSLSWKSATLTRSR
jgi:hypothetical protein